MAISDLLNTRPQALPGVAVLPFPVHNISADLDRAVAEELQKAKPGSTTVALNVRTEAGVNLVIASRSRDGHLSATLWIGKSGWTEPVAKGWAGAISIRGEWGGD